MDIENEFIGPKNLFKSKLEIKSHNKKTNSTTKYPEVLGSSVIEGRVSPETIIYLLKNQLIDASILNHNLQRVISLLAWKFKIEKTVTAVKSELNNILQKTVSSLEKLLTMTSDKHQIMKRKLEMLDYEISQLKLTSHKSFVGSFLAKPHVKKPIKNNSKCGQLEKQNIKGRRLIMPDPCPPIELLSCQESEVHLDRKNNVTEDDGKPIIAEANEEDEKRIDEFHAQKKFKFEDDDLGKLETLEHGLRNAQMDLDRKSVV